MAKRQKEETANLNATPNRDIIQRLNFLYQASVYLQSIPAAEEDRSCKGKEREDTVSESGGMSMTIGQGSTRTTAQSTKTKRKPKKARRPVNRQTPGDLARSYIRCMRVVGQKTTVKIDSSLKRSLCSNCNTTLVPGSSATVRVKKLPSHGHATVYTCLHCKTTKRIPAPLTRVKLATPEIEIPTMGSPSARHPSLLSQFRGGKKNSARLPPLSTRTDAGHAVFRGGEELVVDQERGTGLAFA
ncbi:hypothetical protein NLJ89_g2576 [Agrocybe chaxingu]|uniref:Rpr2-domain-containing protein n=1 Tax=Agrocybe chaxingu TaxID=84603 RepID=A0A9W8MYN6_9AGAR|nr:hypothetical protein NLJ89_g2576 [Agrocybe chaxingu]